MLIVSQLATLPGENSVLSADLRMGGSFFTPFLPTRPRVPVLVLALGPTMPTYKKLIYEYKTMRVPGECAQPLESSGAPLPAQEDGATDLKRFNCMHAFHYKPWPKALEAGSAGQAIKQSCTAC